MNRKKLLLKAFQRGHLLSLKNKLYKSWINKFIADEIKGDVGVKGDITSNAVIRENKKVRAIVASISNGIAAGVEECASLYKNNKIRILKHVKDGARIRKGSVIFELEGSERDLLRAERSAIDILQRMSGIATLANDLVKKVKNKVFIASTRKTQWRYLDKKACFIGGGLTHRLALWDSILIKNNHLAALRNNKVKDCISVALERAWRKKAEANFIEIEAANEKDAIKAAEKFKELNKRNGCPCLVMLDNIKPGNIKRIIKKLKKLKLYDYVLLEASGGINPSNIISYANSGVDVLSLGYLTHSSRALDIKQVIQ